MLNTKTYDVQKTTILEGENIKCFYKNGNSIYIGTENGLFIYNILNQKISKTLDKMHQIIQSGNQYVTCEY